MCTRDVCIIPKTAHFGQRADVVCSVGKSGIVSVARARNVSRCRNGVREHKHRHHDKYNYSLFHDWVSFKIVGFF
jgi:hypothetical protein